MPNDHKATAETAQWIGQSIRVEHLVAPGSRILTYRGAHLKSCPCTCSKVQTCPTCGEVSWPALISGRWDAEAGHTARPFDPVWVRLACGCEFGDESLARASENGTSPGLSSGGDGDG